MALRKEGAGVLWQTAAHLLCPSCTLGNSLGENKSVIDTDSSGHFRGQDRLGFGTQSLSLAL